MIRWKYLLPRLGFVLILVLLLNLFSTPVARFAFVHSIQSVTGAKVDLSGMDVSVWNGTVRINDLQVADPKSPMENLLQADVVDFQLNPAEMLQRRWVVERARLERVQFGTPRTESGALAETDSEEAEPGNSFVVDFVQARVKSLGKDWARQMQANLPGLIEDRLETVQMARQLNEKWPSEFERHRENAISLKRRADILKAEFSQRSDNPLRDLERYRNAVLETRQLLIDFQTAQQEIRDLSRQFQIDREALNAARQRDQNKILNATRSIAIRPDQVTQLLLSEQQAELVRESVAWLKWFRNAVPDAENELQPEIKRGFDVRFRDKPELLIRNLELDGEGMVAGRNVDFSGSVSNVSSAPKLVADPVTFRLRGSGKTDVQITGSVDRRGPQKIDLVNIVCPQIKSEAKVLGEPESLVLNLGPGKSALEIQAKITDERLSGEIQLRQSGVSLVAEKIHEVENADWLIQSLNQQLGVIETFSVAIELGGTLKQPTASLKSDLGEQVAGMMSATFQDSLRMAGESKAAELESLLSEKVVGLDQLFAGSSNEILGMLSRNVAVVADLQTVIKPESLKFPRFR